MSNSERKAVPILILFVYAFFSCSSSQQVDLHPNSQDLSWKEEWKPYPPQESLLKRVNINAQKDPPLEKRIPYDYSAYTRLTLDYIDKSGLKKAQTIEFTRTVIHIAQEYKAICVRLLDYQLDLLLPHETLRYDEELNIFIVLPGEWHSYRILDQKKSETLDEQHPYTDNRVKKFKDENGFFLMEFFY